MHRIFAASERIRVCEGGSVIREATVIDPMFYGELFPQNPGTIVLVQLDEEEENDTDTVIRQWCYGDDEIPRLISDLRARAGCCNRHADELQLTLNQEAETT